jgi:hypothetical protein
MSMMWCLFGYSQTGFDRVFGGGDPDIESIAVDGVLWNEGAFKKPEVVERLTRALVRGGVDYARLHSDEKALLDEVLCMLFMPEGGLVDLLEIEPLSPEGLHPIFVQELVERSRRTRHLRKLPYLVTGRRFGDGKPDETSSYCHFSPQEAAELLDEVRAGMSVAVGWARPDSHLTLTDELVAPLESIVGTGRSLMWIRS